MITLTQVEDQLKKVGCNYRFWGRPEIRELTRILMPGEVIAQAVNGRYKNGFAMLCVTDHRLLLIDKKPMFLTLEDIRFDMIAEIDFSSQLLDGTVRIITPNRELVFTSWSQDKLRIALNYTQQRVSEMRHHFIQQQFQEPDQQQTPEPAPPQQQLQPRMDEGRSPRQFAAFYGYAAPTMGGLALQGNASAAAPQPAPTFRPLPLNPYTKSSLIMRRNRVPKFY